jgi:hypothetical protein
MKCTTFGRGLQEISDTVINALIALGKQQHEGRVDPSLIETLRDHDVINRQPWYFWDSIAQQLGIEDLCALTLGLALAERELRWTGGSVAAAIWTFQSLAKRDQATADALVGDLCAVTRNPYVPFGG